MHGGERHGKVHSESVLLRCHTLNILTSSTVPGLIISRARSTIKGGSWNNDAATSWSLFMDTYSPALIAAQVTIGSIFRRHHALRHLCSCRSRRYLRTEARTKLPQYDEHIIAPRVLKLTSMPSRVSPETHTSGFIQPNYNESVGRWKTGELQLNIGWENTQAELLYIHPPEVQKWRSNIP